LTIFSKRKQNLTELPISADLRNVEA